MTSIHFFVPGAAVGWKTPGQSPRRGVKGHRAGRYKPPEVHHWQMRVEAEAARYRPPEPITGPVAFGAVFLMARPKKDYRKYGGKLVLRSDAPHWAMDGRTADLTNLVKAVEDALTGIIWVDDRQVVKYLPQTHKVYAEEDGEIGVIIEVQALERIKPPGAGGDQVWNWAKSRET